MFTNVYLFINIKAFGINLYSSLTVRQSRLEWNDERQMSRKKVYLHFTNQTEKHLLKKFAGNILEMLIEYLFA